MQVLNLRQPLPAGIDASKVKLCDRRSIVGNPFYLCGEGSRDMVCDAYKQWLWLIHKYRYQPLQAAQYISKKMKVPYGKNRDYPSRSQLLTEIQLLDQYQAVACWCAPKRCHCDELVKYWQWATSTAALELLPCS